MEKSVRKVFNEFLKIGKMKSCSRYTSKRAPFVEKFNRTFRSFPKMSEFGKANRKRINESNAVERQTIKTKPSSNELTTIKEYFKKNGKSVYQNMPQKRKKQKLFKGHQIEMQTRKQLFLKVLQQIGFKCCTQIKKFVFMQNKLIIYKFYLKNKTKHIRKNKRITVEGKKNVLKKIEDKSKCLCTITPG